MLIWVSRHLYSFGIVKVRIDLVYAVSFLSRSHLRGDCGRSWLQDSLVVVKIFSPSLRDFQMNKAFSAYSDVQQHLQINIRPLLCL